MQKTTIRGTTVYCDFKATTGAVLYDAAWMTERDLQRVLLEHSKLIVATPGRYSAHFRAGNRCRRPWNSLKPLPGWAMREPAPCASSFYQPA